MLEHEELIAEKGIKVSELPAEIKKALTTVNRLKGRRQTPNMVLSVTKQSVLICNAITDWIEKDYPDHVAAVEEVKEPVEATPSNPAEETIPATTPEGEVVIPAPAGAPAVENVSDSVEAKIVAALGVGKKVHYSVLKGILGHAPASTVTIGDIRLRRPMLSNWFVKV